ncbi:MAG: acyl-CoA thioesterase [Bacteroidia bacterium]
MAILTSEARIRFQDCDPFGHLNNARFIDYFLNARADQVLENFNIDIFGGSGFTWVVGSNQIAYFKQAKLNEAVLIETQIIAFTEKFLRVEMRMYDRAKKELKALLWVDSIPFSLVTQRSTPHSEELMKMFEVNLMPVEQLTFEERRSALYKINKASSA